MNQTCDHLLADKIVTGHYTDACRAIGEANLPTILLAEQGLAEAQTIAASHGLPCRAYIGLRKLALGRRQRLQREAQQIVQQGNQPATFRL